MIRPFPPQNAAQPTGVSSGGGVASGNAAAAKNLHAWQPRHDLGCSPPGGTEAGRGPSSTRALRRLNIAAGDGRTHFCYRGSERHIPPVPGWLGGGAPYLAWVKSGFILLYGPAELIYNGSVHIYIYILNEQFAYIPIYMAIH